MPPKKVIKLKSSKRMQHQKGQTQHQHVVVHVHAPTKAPRKQYTRKPKVPAGVASSGPNVSLTGGGLLVASTGQQVPNYVPNFYMHPSSVVGPSSVMGYPQYPPSVAPTTSTPAMESPYESRPNPMSSNASTISAFTNPTAFRSVRSYSRSPSPSVVDMNESNVTQRSSIGHGGMDPLSAWRGGGSQKLNIDDEYDFDRPIRMPSQPQVFENPQMIQRVFTKPGIIRDDVSSKSSSASVEVLSLVKPDEPFPIDMVYSNRDDFESNNYLRRMESKPLEMPAPHPIIEDVLKKADSVKSESIVKSPRGPSISLDRLPRENKPEHVKFQEPMDDNLEFTREILHQSKSRGRANEPLDPGILGLLAQKMYIDNFTYKNTPVAGKIKRTASQSEILKAYTANNRTHGSELTSAQFIKDSKKIIRDELRERGLEIPVMFLK